MSCGYWPGKSGRGTPTPCAAAAYRTLCGGAEPAAIAAGGIIETPCAVTPPMTPGCGDGVAEVVVAAAVADAATGTP